MNNECSFWPSQWADPSCKRLSKPRQHGLSMIIDKGLGVQGMKDLLQIAASYIDVYKLGFGTTVLYPLPQLRQKISMAYEADILIMPGGTFFEIATSFSSPRTYLETLREIGFTAVEISDGSLPVALTDRLRTIALARSMGFTVYSEYGKKADGFQAEKNELIETLHHDLDAGSHHVIVEARESGNVGICNASGELDTTFIQEVISEIGSYSSNLIWEAPQKKQQLALLSTIGFDVNLGNIAPTDVLSLEALRRGLRGDTLLSALEDRREILCE